MKRHPQLIQLINTLLFCYAKNILSKIILGSRKRLETLPNDKKEEGKQSFAEMIDKIRFHR